MKALRLALCVARKETLDHARDRRSITSALIYPLVGPLVLAMLFTLVARWNRDDKPHLLSVAGRENAPNLVAFFERQGVTIADAPPDYEARVQEGAIDAVLIVPPGYGKEFSAGTPAKVQLVLDSSRTSAHAGQHRARAWIERFSATIGAQRLLARGVAPELAQAIRVEDKDLATPEKHAATLLNMMPLFLVLAGFVGGMNVAIDVTAGERERGSLEPLLLNPVSRAAIVVGKWLATILAALGAVAVSISMFYLIVHRVPFQDLGVKARLEGMEIVGILLVMVPLAPLASALLMLVATYARRFKEARSYLQVFLALPMVPSMLLAFSPLKTQTWMMLVPIFAQDILLGEVMRGDPVPATWYAVAAASAVALTAVVLAVTTRLFGSEKIVFGR